MKGLAGYVMRGRAQATLVTVGFAALSLIILPLSYLSGAAMALVTMRKGPLEGLIVLGLSAAIVWGLVLVANSAAGHSMAAGFVLAGWLPVWLLGTVLRRSISLPMTLGVGAGIAALGVAAFYAMVPDPAAWWRQILTAVVEQLQAQGGAEMQSEEFEMALDRFAEVMTGVVAAALYASTVISLMLGRWWQSLLYNPGGFRREFHGFRLGRGAAAVLLVVVLVALLAGGTLASLATEISMVLLTLYGFSGVALVHDTIQRKNMSVGWLIGLYVLAFIASLQMIVLLALVGLSDSWLDYRRFLPAPKDDD